MKRQAAWVRLVNTAIGPWARASRPGEPISALEEQDRGLKKIDQQVDLPFLEGMAVLWRLSPRSITESAWSPIQSRWSAAFWRATYRLVKISPPQAIRNIVKTGTGHSADTMMTSAAAVSLRARALPGVPDRNHSTRPAVAASRPSGCPDAPVRLRAGQVHSF
jgi:hypothetical protein